MDSFYSIYYTKQEIQHKSEIASMSKKSSTCYGKKNGDPLTKYNSFEDAEEGDVYANTNYGSKSRPISLSGV